MTKRNEPMDLADALKDPAAFVAGMTETSAVHRSAPGPFPGPWAVAPNGTSIWTTDPTHPKRVCEVIEWPIQKAKANGALIAAAPDLLAACEHVARYLSELSAVGLAPLAVACQDAVAKATGEAQ